MKPQKIHLNFSDSITENLTKILQYFYLSVEIRKYENSEDYDRKLSRKFKLDHQYSHKIIDSCRVLLEDTELAINDFDKYGLQGPTRVSSNMGERYLRLYGILNAVNLQKSVLSQLYEVFKIEGKKRVIQELKQLPIIKLRHKAGSHAVDYIEDGIKDYFILAQMTIEDKGERLLIVGQKSSAQTINLDYELRQFKELYHKYMHELLDKVTSKVLAKSSLVYKDFQIYLSMVDKQIQGNMVSMTANGEFLVIRMPK
ncbi:MAG: hypothetical protein AAF632_20610 [Bacteroidota bacterium]